MSSSFNTAGQKQQQQQQQQQQQNASAATSSNSSTGAGTWNRFVQSVQTNIQNKQESIRVAREAKQAGQVYDRKTKTWRFYLLDEEWRELNETNETTEDHHDSKPEREVADLEYYELLQVSTNANSTEIKRAYYKVARTCHPDKNPDDPEAHSKFQQLGHAYQILSNEQSRAQYDKNGKPDSTSTDNMDNVDPFVFFNVMFGSTLVEPYIGELWLASHTDSMMNDSDGFMMEQDDNLDQLSEEERRKVMHDKMKLASEKQEFIQKKRQVKCAMNLRTRVASYSDDNVTKFTEGCKQEALKIVAGAYGALYCVTIGFALEIAALEYLGFEGGSFLNFKGHLARTRKNASGFASGWKLLGAGIKAASAGSRAMQQAEEMQLKAAMAESQQQQEGGGDNATQKASTVDGNNNSTEGAQDGATLLDETKMAETLDESLPAFLEFAWAINKRDIQTTLKQSCKKLFEDASVVPEERLERARGIEILGRTFQQVGKQHYQKSKDFHPEDIKARVAVATMTTMAKAQGQEVTEQDQQEMMEQAKREQMNVASVDNEGEENEKTAETTQV